MLRPLPSLMAVPGALCPSSSPAASSPTSPNRDGGDPDPPDCVDGDLAPPRQRWHSLHVVDRPPCDSSCMDGFKSWLPRMGVVAALLLVAGGPLSLQVARDTSSLQVAGDPALPASTPTPEISRRLSLPNSSRWPSAPSSPGGSRHSPACPDGTRCDTIDGI